MTNNRENTKKVSRRKFFLGGLATGVLAVGGILTGNKDLLADSLERFGGLRWEATIDGKIVTGGQVPMKGREEVFIEVKNGTARVILDHGHIYLPEDNNICTKKICSLMGSITKSGEKITCLPNKLVIRII
jgi:hypothetical protein